MSAAWMAYLVTSLLTHSPWLGLAAAAFVVLAARGWWSGRMFAPGRWFDRYRRVASLRQEVAANPHNATARAALGALLVETSPAAALPHLEEVHRRFPELALAAYHLGWARLAMGQTEAGRVAIEHALALKPDTGFGEPMVRLGDHLLARGDTEGARVAYRRAVGVHGSFAEAWYKLGRAGAGAGDTVGAREAWAEALHASDGAPGFKRRRDRPWRLRAWLALNFSR